MGMHKDEAAQFATFLTSKGVGFSTYKLDEWPDHVFFWATDMKDNLVDLNREFQKSK